MLIINNRTPIIYNQNLKYSPEPIIYNRKLYTMKPQGSSINKPGSTYIHRHPLYNRTLFKMGAKNLLTFCLLICWFFGFLDSRFDIRRFSMFCLFLSQLCMSVCSSVVSFFGLLSFFCLFFWQRKRGWRWKAEILSMSPWRGRGQSG